MCRGWDGIVATTMAKIAFGKGREVLVHVT